ncbi:hypothetical protein N657DRAFT_308578 [Parathielavia appendiculata]|uniref:Uncharacterized protein n=1 Tax=Parathielavia appendiculata TaxID=2587402 RepID=A0AAN6Z5H3_9PEZI|nr:hypothetical protein N657DRAFT_308578 [Parathielavia appendiculata]
MPPNAAAAMRITRSWGLPSQIGTRTRIGPLSSTTVRIRRMMVGTSFSRAKEGISRRVYRSRAGQGLLDDPDGLLLFVQRLLAAGEAPWEAVYSCRRLGKCRTSGPVPDSLGTYCGMALLSRSFSWPSVCPLFSSARSVFFSHALSHYGYPHGIIIGSLGAFSAFRIPLYHGFRDHLRASNWGQISGRNGERRARQGIKTNTDQLLSHLVSEGEILGRRLVLVLVSWLHDMGVLRTWWIGECQPGRAEHRDASYHGVYGGT